MTEKSPLVPVSLTCLDVWVNYRLHEMFLSSFFSFFLPFLNFEHFKLSLLHFLLCQQDVQKGVKNYIFPFSGSRTVYKRYVQIFFKHCLICETVEWH